MAAVCYVFKDWGVYLWRRIRHDSADCAGDYPIPMAEYAGDYGCRGDFADDAGAPGHQRSHVYRHKGGGANGRAGGNAGGFAAVHLYHAGSKPVFFSVSRE